MAVAPVVTFSWDNLASQQKREVKDIIICPRDDRSSMIKA